MSFTLSTSNLTDTSVSIVMTLTSDYSTSQSVSMSVQEGGSSGSTIYSTTVTIPAGATTGDKIRTPVSSLTASTAYYVATTISGGVIAADLTFTTKNTGYDTAPKIATQGQWEDLADKVQSKAEIGSVLSTPSNVAYVDTNNIVDGAVTADKMNLTGSGIYEELGRATLTTNRIPNDTITLKRSDCKYIKLVFTGSVPTAGATLQIRINGDTGNNYPRGVLHRSFTDNTTTWFVDNSSAIVNAGSAIAANMPMQMSAEISKSPNGWVGWAHTVTSTFVRFGFCQWASTANISSVSIESSTSSVWKSGSSIVVYGHD